jgi:hypothetical protein
MTFWIKSLGSIQCRVFDWIKNMNKNDLITKTLEGKYSATNICNTERK